MEKNKEQFIKALYQTNGIVAAACVAAHVGRSTYYRWMQSDVDFGRKVHDVMETQKDYVESKLLANINAGDTTAIIYYLKTKARDRGWNERVNPEKTAAAQPEPLLPPVERKEMKRLVAAKKAYITRLLKQQDKYTAELSMQVKIVAQLLVRTDLLARDVFGEGYQTITVEISREGNRRESVNPKERLYMEYLRQSQRALRALGMNTDSRERRQDGEDGLNSFLEQLNREE